MLLLAEHAGRPLGGGLGRSPRLAAQAIAAGRAVDRRGVGNRTSIEEVVASARHVADYTNRVLTGAAGVAAPHPRHAVVAAVGFRLLDGRYGIGTRYGLSERHALGQLVPA